MTSILPAIMTGVTVRRRGKTLLGPVDLTISESGLTVLMGPNGAGKTKLLRALHGVERLDAGEVRWQVPLAEAQDRQAFVFQSPIMLRRTVRDNLIYPLCIRGVSRREATELAAEWAAKVGLADALDRMAPRLSGGEKQKLALARALIRRPDIVFLDEPCANLDGRATREIETLLRDAVAGGTRIVMATHDLGQARRLADDVVFLMHGRIIEQSDAASFFAAPSTAAAASLLQGDIVE